MNAQKQRVWCRKPQSGSQIRRRSQWILLTRQELFLSDDEELQMDFMFIGAEGTFVDVSSRRKNDSSYGDLQG